MNARAAGPEQDEATRWMADPSRLLRVCDAAVPRLVALPAATPSLRLLADHRLNCWAASRPPSTGWRYSLPIPPGRLPAVAGVRRLRIPDWLPPFVNAGRTFVAIGATVFTPIRVWRSSAVRRTCLT